MLGRSGMGAGHNLPHIALGLDLDGQDNQKRHEPDDEE